MRQDTFTAIHRQPQGDRAMHEPLRMSGTDMTNPERVHELHATAAEVHGVRRQSHDPTGLLPRARASIGRRIISIGGTVAGHHA